MATVNGGATDDSIPGTGADDLINGLDGDDTLEGRNGADRINGNNDNDILLGEAGNDSLSGGSGTDSLNGGAGDDRLIGGAGDDTLTGGSNGDVFVIEAGSSDIVTDYNSDEGDSLDLSGPGVTLSSAVISESGGNTVIDIGGGESVTLIGVTNAEFNAEPTVSGLTNRGAAEDVTGAPDFSGVTIADTDTPGNITVTITASDTGAVLGAIDGSSVGAGVTETASGNNVVTLVGTAADITTYLANAAAITYTSSQDRETNDTISIQADDGISTPNAASTATILITPINDLPTASDSTITIDEDTSHVFTAADFNFADVDSGDALVSVRIDTLTVGSGTFELSGVAVSATDVITIADINAGNLVYVPGPDDNGNGLLTFTFSVNDGTGFAAATSSGAVDVSPVSDNARPRDLTLDGDRSVDENDAGAVIGTLSATDPEGDAITFRVSGDERFVVSDGNTLRLADGFAFDFEAVGDRAVVEVVATDANGASASQIFVISINDVDETSGGNAGNNDVDGGNGDDTLDGGNGDDTVSGGSGSDRVFGGNGDDTVAGGNGDDTIRGDDGDDRVSGGDGNDIAFAGPGDTGNDTVEGNDGNDILGGGAGSDTLVGGNAGSNVNDTNAGACGDDTLFGGDDDDLIVGGSYNTQTQTVVNTGGGNNQLWGGGGNDRVFGDDGDDLIGGGVGDDSLQAGGGNDTLYGGRAGGESSNDTLRGGNGDDLILASADDDVVAGDDGNDTLFGGAGDDTINGGNGDDILWAGGGNDDLTGGTGSDIFTFGDVSGNDTVNDFTVGEDTLDLRFASTEFASVAEVRAAAMNAVQDSQSGVLIDLGDGDSVFIVGITVDDLTESTVTL